MKVFVWKNGRAEAQYGYNDDLVISFGTALYVRDTALQLNQQGIDITKAALGGISTSKTPYQGVYSANDVKNPYQIDNGKGGSEDFTWILK